MCPAAPIEKEPPIEGSLARGTEVDRFIVLGLVGRGAMGEVYAAHDPDLDRKIAIKLLRSRGGSDPADDGRARLIREAQAIAKVSHPNVVVVYDVGTFDGRVFIAMEFIAGHTLGYWIQSQPRTVAEILEVFTGAGRGLAAAHEKELVHRDFKPENVMVGADGQVRVMDFGLVRLSIDREKNEIDRRLPVNMLTAIDGNVDPLATFVIQGPVEIAAAAGVTSDSLTWNLTQAGAVMGTPAYMSPEQFRGDVSDARSDQFSFCVALYEALYGERPFSGATILELTANVVAARIPPEPEGSRVPRRVRQALLRGMSADPEARFPSMSLLLSELRSDAALAGTRRFAEGAADKLSGIWEAPEDGRPVETDGKAEIRRVFLATGKPYAATAFEATSRILDRFARRWTDVYVEACEATHLLGEQSNEVLDLRMAALSEALRDLRALCRELRQATADTVENAVNAATALGSLERCSDVNLLRAIVRPPDDPATRAAVEQIRVRLSEVRALARVGRVSEGMKVVATLESDARRIGYAPVLAEALLVSGTMHIDVSDFDGATRALEEAVWVAELCRHDEIAAESAACLVYSTGYAKSRFEVAEIWSRHAETVLTRMGGHERMRGWLFNNRGAMRAAQGRLRDAVDDLHRAIEAKERALGPEDPDVGISLANLASYLDDLGESARAATYIERAVRITRQTLGPDHPTVGLPLANQALILNRLGRYEEALEPGRQALALFERETDAEGLYVTSALAALGASYVGLGRFREALPTLERAARILEQKETNPALVGEVHFTLGRALWGSGEDRARGLATVERALGDFRASPPTPATQRALADIELWLSSRVDVAPARPAAVPARLP